MPFVLKPYSSHQKTKILTKRGAERRLLILKTAYALFLEYGYDHVSLDKIIQETGGSKASIYQYFGDKEGLFKAICDYHFSQKTQKFVLSFDENYDLRQYLKQLLLNLYQELHQVENIKFFHMIIQQSRHHSQLVNDLHRRWHIQVHKNLENILAQCHQSNYLYCPNPAFSAILFWGIIHDLRWKSLINIPLENLEEFNHYIDYSIHIFLIGHQYQL